MKYDLFLGQACFVTYLISAYNDGVWVHDLHYGDICIPLHIKYGTKTWCGGVALVLTMHGLCCITQIGSLRYV